MEATLKVMTNRRGQHRRRALVAGSALIAIVATIPFVNAAHATPNPSSNINDYVLYAQSSINLKYGASVSGNIAAGTSSYQDPPGCSTSVPAGTSEYSAFYDMLKPYGCGMYGLFGAPSASGNVHVATCQ